MSSIQKRNLPLYYDLCLAKNHNFIFHHFNQEIRRQTIRSVSLRVKRGDVPTTDLMKMVFEDDFKEYFDNNEAVFDLNLYTLYAFWSGHFNIQAKNIPINTILGKLVVGILLSFNP